jgi:hypothetical protein
VSRYRKKIGGENMEIMNRRESKKIAVMAAVIVGFMMFAFMPMASAGVTSFTVTPSSGVVGVVDSYNALVTTDGVTRINITIPAGFIAVVPATGGVEIARVDFWNSSTKAYYGYATITSSSGHPTTEVGVYCKFGDDAITTTHPISYAAGATNTFKSGFAGDTSSAIIKLPTEGTEGSIKIAINCTAFHLDDVMIAIKQHVRNPTTAGDYDFIADGVTETVSITAQKGRAAVFRHGWWLADRNGDHKTDVYVLYGNPGDKPVVGDIDNNGINDIVAFRNGWWLVSKEDHTGTDWTKSFVWGQTGDLPVIGDIDNNGISDIVAFRNGWWLVLKEDHTGTDWAKSFVWGQAGDKPVIADIDNNGDLSSGVKRVINQ